MPPAPLLEQRLWWSPHKGEPHDRAEQRCPCYSLPASPHDLDPAGRLARAVPECAPVSWGRPLSRPDA
jgi:hypothetical protein